MKTKRKINYVIYPNKLKITKTGTIPLYVRIVLGNKAEWNSGIEITANVLTKWNKINFSLNEKYCEVNERLYAYQAELNDSLKIFEESANTFSASEIKKILLNNNETKKCTIHTYLQEYYCDKVENSSTFAMGTKKNYKKAINHLKSFISSQELDEAPVQAVNYAFAFKFKNYLTNSQSSPPRKGMCENSAKSIIKKFRTIFNDAVSKKYISANPFKELPLTGKAKEKVTLNIQQLYNLYHAKNLTYSQKVYTDIFLFSVYTGLSYSDAQSLNSNYITEYGNQILRIDSSRMKTVKTFTFFLPDLAKEIIDKYKNTIETVNGNLIPNRCLKEVNIQLKTLADKAGIPINLSTGYARHTFRVLCGEAGLQDETCINRMAGWSRGNSMHGIYDRATDTRLIRAKESLDLYLQYLKNITPNGQ
jgi:integrase/recombinase XerD